MCGLSVLFLYLCAKNKLFVMKIAVYCSARDNIAQIHRDDAVALAHWMGANGHSLVYGGLDCGLMGVMGREVTASGGHAIGVVPQARSNKEHPDNMVNIYVNDLHERKAVMDREADVHVALAGGVGTLDEVMSVMVAHIFDRTPVDIYLLNRDGLYDRLADLFDRMADEHLAQHDTIDARLHTVPDIDALIAALSARAE